MICLICRQAEVVEKRTSVHFERGEFQWTANDVPARVCPRCGEAYVAEEVAVQLLQTANERYKAGFQE